LNRVRLTDALRRRVGRDTILRSTREAARAAEADVWLVGGFVRDTALALRPRDVDLVVGRGVRRLIRELESRWNARAFRFRKRGVTTWRLAVGPRLVDLVDAAHRGLEADLRRRELTINAIAYDLIRVRIEDPLHGLADLRARRLRLPRPDALSDDPVRALRVARFLAQLPEFRTLPETRSAAMSAACGVRRAAAERIRAELSRMLTVRMPTRGLEALDELGLLEVVLPELVALRSCRAGQDRPDVWRHTLDAIACSTRAGRLPGGPAPRDEEAVRVLRWALLLHDVAKPDTLAWDDTGKPSFHGHEVLGAGRADAILLRLRFATRERRRVRALILNHLRPGHLADAGAPERGLRRLVRDAGDDTPILVLHAACDAQASGSPDAAARWRRMRRVLVRLLELEEAARVTPLPRLVDGRQLLRALNLEPGPIVGQILRRLRELQEVGKIATRKEALEAASRLVTKSGRLREP
jgi:poly(A) polymerase